MKANMIEVLFSSLFLLSAILAAVAWYLTSTYQLPLPVPGLPVISTFLPIVEFIVTYYTTRRIRGLFDDQTGPTNGRKTILYLLILINLELLLVPAVLITTSAPALFPANRCPLGDAWQRWYSAKDENAIKGVQDALHCCGFVTPIDRPFPFSRSAKKGKSDGVPSDLCARRLGSGDPTRVSPCLPLWEAKMQKTVGFLIAAGGVIIVVKLAFLMAALGNPEMIGRFFRRPHAQEVTQVYSEDNSNRVITVDDGADGSDEENDPPSDDDSEPASGHGTGGMNGNGQRTYGTVGSTEWIS
ncbi:hypothetical protein Dda_4421 [Drechslerella dactyloides]|uniref:Tetraspanin Tsp3 n=1 Tax=Drechslerella dactyloides TaxID=74499 RepID=A0AAD6NJ94_DREDA|nr:hypothetical protein Dda_4421 [Drechslerella dactyloides]